MPDPTPLPSPFVTCAWLAGHLDDPAVQVVDGSWYLPAQNRDAAREYAEGHIPGAIFLDIDAVSDHGTTLPHMLLDDAGFAAAAGALGIASDTTLVVYDGAGLFSAPRVRWMLQLYGARAVVLLDGGLPQWKAEGHPLQSGPSQTRPAVFRAARRPGRVVDLAAVKQVLAQGPAEVVDARAAARFAGTAPEPRPGLASGHMPGSRNVPFTAVMDGGRLADAAQVRQAFATAGVDLDRPVVASCGSGVTAAILVLALESIGKTDAALYDGSWSEYASQPGAAIATR